MAVFAVRLEPSGRILIPADLRRKLNLRPGEDVLLSVNENGLYLTGNRVSAILRIQERMRRYSPERILSEELIAERREEARKEALE